MHYPAKYRFLSGSWLKLIAVATMVIDHIASVFLKKDQTVFLRLFGRTLTRYEAMRMIGRVSFPLFAFLLVEGFVHTCDRKKYGIRLLALA